MRYFLIAGETSGDLHASYLMRALREQDPHAEFLFIGGDHMESEGGKNLIHNRSLAFMGFIPVLLHLPTILRGIALCKTAIRTWQPHCVILIDYPSFNLKIANYVYRNNLCPIYYYISPKVWAWKEGRVPRIRKMITRLFSILPFEVDFYKERHNYSVTYVGNPTVDEVVTFQQNYTTPNSKFLNLYQLSQQRPIIAILPGSRQQEIHDNLRKMCLACEPFIEQGCQIVVASAPNISSEVYNKIFLSLPKSLRPTIIENATFPLLSHANVALVTSGTATLETALFRVPQIVCYHTPLGAIVGFLRKYFLNVRFISLVNLIGNREIVPELVADTMTVQHIRKHLAPLLTDSKERQQMLKNYEDVISRLGKPGAPQRTATEIIKDLHYRLAES